MSRSIITAVLATLVGVLANAHHGPHAIGSGDSYVLDEDAPVLVSGDSRCTPEGAIEPRGQSGDS